MGVLQVALKRHPLKGEYLRYTVSAMAGHQRVSVPPHLPFPPLYTL